MDTFAYLRNLYSRIKPEEKYKTIEVPEEDNFEENFNKFGLEGPMEIPREFTKEVMIEELINTKNDLINLLKRENEELKEQITEFRNRNPNLEPQKPIQRFVPFNDLRVKVEEHYKALAKEKKEVRNDKV